MPYNTTPIQPRNEVTGQVQLPLSRVKKIIAVDPDISICSNNAAFAITLATELFIQYLAEQGHNMAKLDRKPRRNIQYKDLSAAVHHQDNLEFLEDTIPKAVPYKEVKQKAAETRAKLTGANPASAPPPASAEDDAAAAVAVAATTTNGNSSGSKKQKTLSNGVNGLGLADVVKEPSSHGEEPAAAAEAPAATGDDDDDVQMTG